jgi:NitT/TauT family transport system permease protein
MSKPYYSQLKSSFPIAMNYWDVVILLLMFGIMAAIVWGSAQMVGPYQVGETIPINLSPLALPGYAIQTVLRMVIALFFSFLVTFTIGTWAAKSKQAEKILLPLVDILQSIPVLGFLSISVLGFIYLFPGSMLGPECAAIFAIFSSQAWNMILSFYQSLKTLPKELRDAAMNLQLGAWQRFWRLEVPFAMPALLWNTMVSLSASWFFVVASEAFSIANQQISLPGIGSYISYATMQSDYRAIGFAIVAMLVVIILYDQLIFRPLIIWSEKFRPDHNENEESTSWFLNLLQKTNIKKHTLKLFINTRDILVHSRYFLNTHQFTLLPTEHSAWVKKLTKWVSYSLISLAIIVSIGLIFQFVYLNLSLPEVGKVFYFGLISAIKIAILILLSSFIWVPIGVWIGLNPRLSGVIQPILQIFAAFPANLLYPVLFMLIIQYNLNVDIFTSPLMILGTQWYILFNVVAGAGTLSKEIKMVAKNYGVTGFLWWKRIILPAIFPYYITGAMTAAGGCWNASIISDVITWGDKTIQATGLGGYITIAFQSGDFPRMTLGIAVMCIYVILFNRLIWHKFYEIAENRFNSNMNY